MSEISIQQAADGTGTVMITGVPIAAYVPPVLAAPDPVEAAPAPTAVASAVLAVCEYVVAGSTITVTNKSTSARPVASASFSRGDGTSARALAIDESYTYTTTRTSVTPILTVTDDTGVKDSAFMSFALPTNASGTAIGRGAPDPSAQPPSDPPPTSDAPPSQPAPTDLPPPSGTTHSVVARTTIDNVQWTATAVVGEDPTEFCQYYFKFIDPNGNPHPSLRLLAFADCCEVGAVNGRSGMGYVGSLTIEYDGEVVWDAAQVLFFCGTLNKTIRYGKFQPKWKPVQDGLFPNYAKPASPLQISLQKYDWSYNGAGYCSVLAQQTTGMRGEIAVIPPPDIPFVLDPSDATYAWVRQVADNDGAWAIARLDDATGMPFDIRTYPNATLMGSPPFSGNPIVPKINDGVVPVCPTTWDVAHHTGYGFVVAAATGSVRDRLHAAILGNAALTALNPGYRQQCGVWAHYQERGSAWALRSLFYASRVGLMSDYFVGQLGVQRQQGERQITNATGMQGTYINRTFPDGSKGTAQWEENFTRLMLGVIAANEPAWETLRARMAKGLSLFMVSPQYQLATGYTLAWRNVDGSDKTTLSDMLQSTLYSWDAADIATAVSSAVTAAEMSALIAKYQSGWAGKTGDFMQYVTATDGYPAIVRAATAANFAVDSKEWTTCDGVPTKPAFTADTWQWNIVPRAA